jgi:hypothetical protein
MTSLLLAYCLFSLGMTSVYDQVVAAEIRPANGYLEQQKKDGSPSRSIPEGNTIPKIWAGSLSRKLCGACILI